MLVGDLYRLIDSPYITFSNSSIAAINIIIIVTWSVTVDFGLLTNYSYFPIIHPFKIIFTPFCLSLVKKILKLSNHFFSKKRLLVMGCSIFIDIPS